MFGGLIASGWHTGAMLIRMVCDNALAGAATSGALGFDDLRWLEPVRPGDVLSVETRIREKLESRSRRDIGIVKIDSRVLNQRAETVMTLTSLVLYRRRPPAEPA
jgi:acyl dehydratase